VIDKAMQTSATNNHPQYKIFCNGIVTDAFPAFGFDLPGEIPMKVNDKAPDFTLQDENEKEVALKDMRGKTVVLYFYPRADTPG
jgi:cytochrome oxidase Cu insertion factor (SCO1/SenC/PrrC family)